LLTGTLFNGVEPPVFVGWRGLSDRNVPLAYKNYILLFEREKNVGGYFGPEQNTPENYPLNYLQIIANPPEDAVILVFSP